MSQGIRGFYQVTKTLEDQLLLDVNCKTVTTGDISNVNLEKQDIFPLSHILINSVTQSDNNGSATYNFNVSILSMDIVDQSKEPTTDLFRLIELTYCLQTFEFFTERFENELAGVTATFNIVIYNDIWIC